MLHGWKKEEAKAEQKHEENSHSKSVQKSKSDHRKQIILPFCILFFLAF